MFCSYCGYGQLPMDAPCCYICGKSPPYSTQPLSIAKRGFSCLSGECPACRSRYTTSGRENLRKDISICFFGTILTLGIGLIIFIPYVLVHIVTKYYTPNRYWCINCKHMWDEREPTAAFVLPNSLAQEKSKIRYPRRIFLTFILLLAVAFIIILPILLTRQPQEGQPLGYTSSILAYVDIAILVIALIFEIIAWIWTLVIAVQRGQKEWQLSLLLIPLIALPLYLIFNPISED